MIILDLQDVQGRKILEQSFYTLNQIVIQITVRNENKIIKRAISRSTGVSNQS